MLGSLHRRDDGRFELRFARHLAHPIDKVWRAITDPEQLRAWFPAAVDMDLAVGAKLRFELTPEAQQRHEIPDEDMTSYGEVVAVDPPRLLEYTWSGEILRWELEPTADGCRLRLTNVFDDRAMAADDGAGWHVALEALGMALDGREVDRPALFGRADEMTGTYACHLGRG
jgi:uncharacterized protein YndB with AHSA1/START domain